MKSIPITERIGRALEQLTAAEADYIPGRDPSSDVDVHKIRLADAVVDAIARQARLPERADGGVVYVTLHRTRRKPA